MIETGKFQIAQERHFEMPDTNTENFCIIHLYGVNIGRQTNNTDEILAIVSQSGPWKVATEEFTISLCVSIFKKE